MFIHITTVFFMLSTLFLWDFQPQESSDTIPWSDEYVLTWDDFQAKPKKGHFAAALSDISFAIDIHSEQNDLVVVVQTFFNPDKSWVKEEGRNEYLLKHEQCHFDLYEVNARKLRKELQSTRFTQANVQSTINRIVEKYSKYNESSQAEYDEQTNHSLKEKNQEIWNRRIAEDLEELAPYAATMFRVVVEER